MGGGVDPSFSPVNSKVLYSNPPEGIHYRDIYVMDSDGNGEKNLTNDPDLDEVFPAWSPDGKKIAYIGANKDTYLFTMDSDGSNKYNTGVDNLIHYVEEGIVYAGITWSPNSQKIAILRHGYPSSGEYIYLYDLSDKSLEKLTDGDGNIYSPAWSPY